MNLDALGRMPHRRYNPLTREWVLVSPHRNQRPWQGQVEDAGREQQPEYDPGCYLCPGNDRAGGHRNPKYDSTFVFDNDFAALKPETEAIDVDEKGLIVARDERGVCRVICFSPRHDLTLARMSRAEIRAVIEVWVSQYQDLGAMPWINYVQIFENRGSMMGASNPHPHCQIWANASVPNEPAREEASFLAHRERNGSCLLCEYVALESEAGTRVVALYPATSPSSASTTSNSANSRTRPSLACDSPAKNWAAPPAMLSFEPWMEKTQRDINSGSRPNWS
jgi:UDPglucose--hexose-1-phosphate uridylyltransferase